MWNRVRLVFDFVAARDAGCARGRRASAEIMIVFIPSMALRKGLELLPSLEYPAWLTRPARANERIFVSSQNTRPENRK